MQWGYGPGDEPDPHLVAKEVNGYDLKTGKARESPSCPSWMLLASTECRWC